MQFGCSPDGYSLRGDWTCTIMWSTFESGERVEYDTNDNGKGNNDDGEQQWSASLLFGDGKIGSMAIVKFRHWSESSLSGEYLELRRTASGITARAEYA